MVILIAGASQTGKTLMAQKLLEKYKTPYLSIDHLKMGIFRSGFDYGFTPESKDEIIIEKLWSIIKGIIMTNIENDQNIIIEGCYFPETIDELNEEYLNKIIFLHIIFSEQYIQKNINEKINNHRSVIENRGYDCQFSEENLEEYILINNENKEKCKKNGIKYFEIKNDYEKEIEEVYKWIDEEIKKIK